MIKLKTLTICTNFQAVNITNDVTNVFFMSYHTSVSRSYDFYTTLKEARKLTDSVIDEFKKHDDEAKFFPYRFAIETLCF